MHPNPREYWHFRCFSENMRSCPGLFPAALPAFLKLFIPKRIRLLSTACDYFETTFPEFSMSLRPCVWGSLVALLLLDDLAK
jgi:hypothetical protein